MKHLLPLSLLAIAALGCGHNSEFDISPAQAKTRMIGNGPPDLSKLPPGAVKHEKVYHKGDVLPDGSISDGERKVVTVEVKH
ncbi:hypothetical protein BH11ARM2_BH11ARM2_07630 [soil metagenome]